MTFSAAGFRTVIVDGDRRRAGVSSGFGAEQKRGLVDYRGGRVADAGMVHDTVEERLFVVPYGITPPEVHEHVAHTTRELIDELRGTFDVVIVDRPSLGVDTVAEAIATATSGLVVVQRAGSPGSRHDVARGAGVVGLPMRWIGTVINGVAVPDS